MITGLSHTVRRDSFLYFSGNGADVGGEDVWLTSVNRIQVFFINKEDSIDLLKNQCMKIYKEKHAESVKKELKLWAETTLGARPNGTGIQLVNKTGAYIWIKEVGKEETKLEAWAKQSFPSGVNSTYHIRYGKTCYKWEPEEAKNYNVVLLALGAGGCGFNMHAGCLDVSGDKAPPVEHTKKCD